MKAWGLYFIRVFLAAEAKSLESEFRMDILGVIAFQLRNREADPAIVRRLLKSLPHIYDQARS